MYLIRGENTLKTKLGHISPNVHNFTRKHTHIRSIWFKEKSGILYIYFQYFVRLTTKILFGIQICTLVFIFSI